jgi:hypothetical protein
MFPQFGGYYSGSSLESPHKRVESVRYQRVFICSRCHPALRTCCLLRRHRSVQTKAGSRRVMDLNGLVSPLGAAQRNPRTGLTGSNRPGEYLDMHLWTFERAKDDPPGVGEWKAHPATITRQACLHRHIIRPKRAFVRPRRAGPRRGPHDWRRYPQDFLHRCGQAEMEPATGLISRPGRPLSKFRPTRPSRHAPIRSGLAARLRIREATSDHAQRRTRFAPFGKVGRGFSKSRGMDQTPSQDTPAISRDQTHHRPSVPRLVRIENQPCFWRSAKGVARCPPPGRRPSNAP